MENTKVIIVCLILVFVPFIFGIWAGRDVQKDIDKNIQPLTIGDERLVNLENNQAIQEDHIIQLLSAVCRLDGHEEVYYFGILNLFKKDYDKTTTNHR